MNRLLQRKGVGTAYKLTTFQRGIKKQFSQTWPGRQPGPLGALSLEGQILKCISNPKGSAEGEPTSTKSNWDCQEQLPRSGTAQRDFLDLSPQQTSTIWDEIWRDRHWTQVKFCFLFVLKGSVDCIVLLPRRRAGAGELFYHWKEFPSGELCYSQDPKI